LPLCGSPDNPEDDMLTLYRRHRVSCPDQEKGRDYRRCACPIRGTRLRQADIQLRDDHRLLGFRELARKEGDERFLRRANLGFIEKNTNSPTKSSDLKLGCSARKALICSESVT
jgi:hypothetical protein